MKLDEKGLFAAITQDINSKEVLMMAFMNEEALQKTLETGLVHYYSRSRGKLWKKGETSGHSQRVKEVLLDCDEDALLIKVEQSGGACHTGYRSCFYRRLDGTAIGEQVFDPKEVYKG